MASASTSSIDTTASATDMAPAATGAVTGPCQVCKIPSTLKCSACSSVFYCSPEHQKQDWKKHKADGGCSPLQKAQDDHYGRYWIASRNIKAGELILKELPVIVSPITSKNQLAFCVSCCTRLVPRETQFQEESHMVELLEKMGKLCQKCGWPVCGVDCEKAPIHADNECPIFASRSVKFPVSPPSRIGTQAALGQSPMFTQGISLIRGLLLKRNHPATWNKIVELQEKNNRWVFATSSLEKERIRQASYNISQAVCQEFKVSDLGLQEDWVRLEGILETNQFGVGRHEVGKPLDSQMSGLYVQGSLFSHSCIPNTFRNISYSPAFELHIRAAVDIKKGEMITLNYYSETMLYGTDLRLHKAMASSGFLCRCARCMDPTDMGTYLSAIICDRCPEKGIMLPATFQNPEEPYRCQTPGCKNTKDRLSVASMTSIYHREISKNASLQGLITDTAKLEEFISRLSGKILHPNHWLLLEAERGCLLAYKETYETNAEHSRRLLLYGRRRVDFSAATSPGISVERALFQLSIVQAMVLDVTRQERTLSRAEAYDRWSEISNWASDAMKYWKIDVEYKPPEIETSQEENLMNAIMMAATDKLWELH